MYFSVHHEKFMRNLNNPLNVSIKYDIFEVFDSPQSDMKFFIRLCLWRRLEKVGHHKTTKQLNTK
jgi:hypothetical protein